MRKELIESLLCEVIGPREGAVERIGSNPYKEYLTGVIIPKRFGTSERNPDSELTVTPGEETDADGEGEVNENSFSMSELDPTSKPRSFGMSFMIHGASAEIEICATWGRYKRVKDGDESYWQREPNFSVQKIAIDGNPRCQRINLFKGAGQISIQVRNKVQPDGNTVVTILMVNDLDPIPGSDKDQAILAECTIYQPSLRVIISKNSTLVSMPTIYDEGRLSFLYRNKPILARGFICAAIWREIEYANKIKNSIHWPDGLTSPDCKRFFDCDARTEFVPLYAQPSPDLNNVDGVPPISAESLSEMWEPDEIDERLGPLVRRYERWVRENRNISETEKDTDARNEMKSLVDLQEVSLVRMREGIEVLKNDIDARLAFCFANKVIAQQFSWNERRKDPSTKKVFNWYPYQIAFFLINVEPICNKGSKERETLDLLWVPTGGGKTETYMALMAFTMAYRRRHAIRTKNGDGRGTAIITRYTLRLLTVQQFRRTMRMITAAEWLRNLHNSCGTYGWLPQKCTVDDPWVYGSVRFSCGLWVGTDVTPNHLRKKNGAIDALKGLASEGEPAQLTRCPVCDSILSVTGKGLEEKRDHVIYWAVETSMDQVEVARSLNGEKFDNVHSIDIIPLNQGHLITLVVTIRSNKVVREGELDDIWEQIRTRCPHLRLRLVAIRASRPGYVGIDLEKGRRAKTSHDFSDFEIICPNPKCDLNSLEGQYREDVMITSERHAQKDRPCSTSVVMERGHPLLTSIPIPAYTVDEQIYHRCPTIIIGTVDKVARLPFEPRAASIVGNIDRYNAVYGYHRDGLLPEDTTKVDERRSSPVSRFAPPELIVQDELHLLDGPLGSMFGLYECTLESLILAMGGPVPRYISSSATSKMAEGQAMKLFAKKLYQFPAFGLDISDNLLVRYPSISEGWNEDRSGRIFMGLCTPGLGPNTPMTRVWARLLMEVYEQRTDPAAKYYWTLVGYFNTIRSLGNTVALYRENIIERVDELANIARRQPRSLDMTNFVELHGSMDSTLVPQVLSDLEDGITKPLQQNKDAVFTTAMFGTGVDVPQLSVMLMDGQPKTTSQYIQAAGRVGRNHGGLVIVFLRAGRTRDLSHYELFSSYHHRIYLDVEPPSVSPFSKGAMRKAGGPTIVGYLRNIPDPRVDWATKNDGHVIVNSGADRDIADFIEALESRLSLIEPMNRNEIVNYYRGQVDMWSNLSTQIAREILLMNQTLGPGSVPSNVVLGTPAHSAVQVVYPNSPRSLRDIEETTTFGV